MSRLAIIFFDLRASYASYGTMRMEPKRKTTKRTKRNENIIHPTNNHLPILKGIKKQPSWSWHLAKISLDQPLVVNIVIAEKMSET